MPRYPYPPHDFVCSYEHNCPYLDGLSTKWVLGEYRRADDTYHEHLRIIDVLDGELETARKRIRELERDYAELKAKYYVLHQRQFKTNRKKRGDPDEEAAARARRLKAKEKKRLGAPVGHPGWYRPKPTEIDRTVRVPAPSICPHCRSDHLTPQSSVREHIHEDIVVRPRTVVTQYLHDEAFCPRCRRSVVQAAEDELIGAPIGPLAKATAMYLRYGVCIPYRKVEEILRVLFGLSCVPASLVGFDRKAARNGERIYKDLLEKIRASDVVHADETSWRNDGVNHFVWYAGNDKLAFFHIDRHRSADVADAIFGKDFGGTLVRDRYAAYNGIGGQGEQSCLAHISTKAKEIHREHALLPDSEKDKNVDSFGNSVRNLCSRACEAGQKLKSGEILWDAAAGMEKHLVRELGKICKRPLGFKPAETLRTYLIGPEQKNLFTFLRHPGVPPTNNQAEQSLRKMVIFRKICFGTRSENGLKTHSILPSLVQTARRQGVHPLKFLKTLLTADTATAQAALYNNSS